MGGQGEQQMEDGGDCRRRMHTGEKRGLGVGGRQVGQRGKVQGLVLWWVDSAGTALVDRNRKTSNEEAVRRRTSRHPPLTPRDEPTLNEHPSSPCLHRVRDRPPSESPFPPSDSTSARQMQLTTNGVDACRYRVRLDTYGRALRWRADNRQQPSFGRRQIRASCL